MELPRNSNYQSSGDGHEASSSRKGNKKRQRHTSEQIQRLEEFFINCTHPDENDRKQLCRELGLEPNQIMFWFQNKRTQIKAQTERAETTALRQLNENIRRENFAMKETLKNVVCPTCDGLLISGEEQQLSLQRLQLENSYLKQEHDKLANLLPKYNATPVVGSSLNLSPGCSMNQVIARPPLNLSPTNPALAYQLKENAEMEKALMKYIADSAMEELVKLFQIEKPIWIKSPTNGRYLLNRDNYDKMFPKAKHFKNSRARVESSKDSGVVHISAAHLIDMFLDSNKWEELFPTIVTTAKTIEVLETGMSGNRNGCLQLMYEQIHILSPLVLPRAFYFLRHCQQTEPGTWVIADVSYNSAKGSFARQPQSWRLPSGCMIEDMHNGYAKITWIEHMEVDDKTQTHRLYRDLICSSVAYGAERWIVTLQRMCERFDCLMDDVGSTCVFGGVVTLPEGKKSLMKLSQRMVKNFCGMLSMEGKLDFPQLSEVDSSGIRVSVHKSAEIGQPHGTIVSIATSLWLPLSSQTIFNFFRDEKTRIQWDVLSHGNPVHEIAYISTGTHPENHISIIRPFIPTEDNMLMLQECHIDPLGSFIIYAPVDIQTLNVAISGEDSSNIAILPSGFLISGDGHPEMGDACGSLVTVAFHILVSSPTTSEQMNMELVATVNTLISSTVKKIKVALKCSGLD
ncbi:homeobox-leucine zipper protein HDG11-like [Pyrus x bretschneideri]|uniref:homeobox-leucine zipper protein HDG11-like n=1 Tax=Pyrus x bretschneideri TaxID=225117 RepID=UPI00202FDE74|nr:homeobox-leucine zipper protein HDG11-like [Pyrus x bretschneideri]